MQKGNQVQLAMKLAKGIRLLPGFKGFPRQPKVLETKDRSKETNVQKGNPNIGDN